MTEREAGDWVVANGGFFPHLTRLYRAELVWGSLNDGAQELRCEALRVLRQYDPSRGPIKNFVAGTLRLFVMRERVRLRAAKRTPDREMWGDSHDSATSFSGRRVAEPCVEVDSTDAYEHLLSLMGGPCGRIARRLYERGETIIAIAQSLGRDRTSVSRVFRDRLAMVRRQLQRAA